MLALSLVPAQGQTLCHGIMVSSTFQQAPREGKCPGRDEGSSLLGALWRAGVEMNEGCTISLHSHQL